MNHFNAQNMHSLIRNLCYDVMLAQIKKPPTDGLGKSIEVASHAINARKKVSTIIKDILRTNQKPQLKKGLWTCPSTNSTLDSRDCLTGEETAFNRTIYMTNFSLFPPPAIPYLSLIHI